MSTCLIVDRDDKYIIGGHALKVDVFGFPQHQVSVELNIDKREIRFHGLRTNDNEIDGFQRELDLWYKLPPGYDLAKLKLRYLDGFFFVWIPSYPGDEPTDWLNCEPLRGRTAGKFCDATVCLD